MNYGSLSLNKWSFLYVSQDKYTLLEHGRSEGCREDICSRARLCAKHFLKQSFLKYVVFGKETGQETQL